MILLQIKLTPSTTLTFQLERGAQPKTVTVVTASYCIDVLGPLIIFLLHPGPESCECYQQ